MLNEIIDQYDLYTSFVGSEEWNEQVATIQEISPDAAIAIGEYGIGEKVSDGGQYDFESGQLLANMPKNVRNSQAIEDAYDAICDLANAYADFVCAFEVPE